MNSAQPQQLRMATADTLEIQWSDGLVHRYTVRHLRDNCPCANCMEKKKAPPPPPTSLPILTAAETQPLRIAKMEPMGRYAYSIQFSDGHDTGLYTLDALRELGEEV
ncbi:MAG: DUF971 domain-containing protein [Planctomycetota bacterium]